MNRGAGGGATVSRMDLRGLGDRMRLPPALMLWLVLMVGVVVLAGCARAGTDPSSAPGTSDASPGPTSTGDPDVAAEPQSTGIVGDGTEPAVAPSTPASPAPHTLTAPPSGVAERPAWLGTRPLPRRADGFGEVLDTPPELEDRRLPPPQARPADAERFEATVEAVPDDVAARSTWSPECPVPLDDLRYLTVSFWGFDGTAHAGELLVYAGAAEGLVQVFQHLFDARFPIEEMRVVATEELYVEPTGDGNNTTAFVCRPVRGSSSWSQHAYGLAVDINPFHNPYVRGDLVLPELASAYLDREWERPGMIQPGDVVTEAFAAIGWKWGGDWASPDWMHFSSTGR